MSSASGVPLGLSCCSSVQLDLPALPLAAGTTFRGCKVFNLNHFHRLAIHEAVEWTSIDRVVACSRALEVKLSDTALNEIVMLCVPTA